MRWEYKTLTSVFPQDLDDTLNEEGKDGWEAFHIGENEKYFGHTIKLKREKTLKNEVLNG